MALSKRQQGRLKHQFQMENKEKRQTLKNSKKSFFGWLWRHLPDLIVFFEACWNFVKILV